MATVDTEPHRAADAGSPEGLSWRDGLNVVARRVATAVIAGMACGLLIGGVGGRIAMFVLRLTSDDSLRGLETDDGFEIGIISFSSLFLLFFTMLIGAFGGAIYLALRRFVPAPWRVAVSALGFGALGGGAILKPGEFDFEVVEPRYLSVILFIVIPVAYGVVLSIVVERGAARGRRPWFAYLPILLLLPTGPVVGLFAAVVLLGFLLVRAVPAVAGAWRADAVTWAGRAALAAGIAYGSFVLADEAAAIL